MKIIVAFLLAALIASGISSDTLLLKNINNTPAAYSDPISFCDDKKENLPVSTEFTPNIYWSDPTFSVKCFGSFEGDHNDASVYDWKGKEDLLYTLEFSSDTKWPSDEDMPEIFRKKDRDRIMEFGKDPGLGVRKLQSLGYTGKGVNVAIIDMPLLLDHVEYKDRDIHYYLINEKELEGKGPSSHGSGMTSILVGKNMGVVPKSTLHYFANPLSLPSQKDPADTLKKIMDMNEGMPDDKKIKVVSMSFCAVKEQKDHDLLRQRIVEARKNGIIVIDVTAMPFAKVTCLPFQDKDLPENYIIPDEIVESRITQPGQLFVPNGGKTIANYGSTTQYFYQTNSGISSAIPYVAGVVAMGVQADPSLTHDKAMAYLWDSGYDYHEGKLINPVGFVEMVRKNCKNPRNISPEKDFRYFLYNSTKVDSADMAAIQAYISKFGTKEDTATAIIPAIISNQEARISHEDDWNEYSAIISSSKFITEGFKLTELSAAQDKTSIYIKLRYISPNAYDILLYLGGDAPGLHERYTNGTKAGENTIIIKFTKEELAGFSSSLCIAVGDENSIILEKKLTDQIAGN